MILDPYVYWYGRKPALKNWSCEHESPQSSWITRLADLFHPGLPKERILFGFILGAVIFILHCLFLLSLWVGLLAWGIALSSYPIPVQIQGTSSPYIFIMKSWWWRSSFHFCLNSLCSSFLFRVLYKISRFAGFYRRYICGIQQGLYACPTCSA